MQLLLSTLTYCSDTFPENFLWLFVYLCSLHIVFALLSLLSGGRFGGNPQEGALQPRFGHQGSYCSKTSSDCRLSGDKEFVRKI